MESFEETNVNNNKLLEVPGSTDCTEEDDVKATIKPRFSPLPRRRSSVCSDDGDFEPPATVARKVSFADAFGFDLVSVKEFDSWEVPTVLPNSVMETTKIEEYILIPSFILPPISISMEGLHAKKVTLESVDFISGTTSMKGVVRVLNLSYQKQVYVRMSLDDWQSYYDQVAEYIPDSCNGETDQFYFTLSLAEPYQIEGVRVEFCICYETTVGTFWDNNDGHNYILTCQKRERFEEVNKSLEEVMDKNKKSCLKPALSKEDDDTDVYEAEKSAVKENYIPRIICSHDEFTEDNHEEEDKRAEDNNGEESDLELFLSQRLMKANITSYEEKRSTETSDKSSLQKERQQDTEIKYSPEDYSVTQDHYSQELQLFDKKGDYPPVTEHHETLIAEDFIATPNISCYSEDHETLSPEYLYETEETALNPAEISDSHPETSRTLSFPQGKSIDETEALDHNANPSLNQNTVLTEYFSTDNTEGEEYESNQNTKIEAENRQYARDISHYDDILWKGTDIAVAQTSTTFSEHDDHGELPSHYEASNSVVHEKEHAEIKQSISSPVSSDEIYIFRDSKMTDTAEEKTRQSIDADYISEISKETHLSDSRSMSSPVAKQYYVTVQDHSSNHNDHDKKYTIHNKRSVGLPHKEKQYDIKYPSYEDKEIVLDNTDRTVSGITETELICQRGSLPEMPLLTCSTTENMTSAKLHVTSESLGTVPSEVTLGSKVIIAKITEEKGQSETCSQGRDDRKRLYIDMRGSGGIGEQTSVLHEEKSILISEGNTDVIRIHQRNMPLSIDRESTDVIESTHNLTTISEEDVTHEGFEYISKELSRYHIKNRSDDYHSESNIPHANLNPASQPSKSFTRLKDNKDLELWDDSSKLAVENKDLQLNVTDDSVIEEENLDNIQDGPEQSYDGPSILISEPDAEGEVLGTDNEVRGLEDTHQHYNLPFTTHEKHTEKEIKTDKVSTEHLNIRRISSKVLCFIMFVVFAGLMYHYDFLVCFGLYLFSLYWLYWEGDRGKNIVKKE